MTKLLFVRFVPGQPLFLPERLDVCIIAVVWVKE